LGSGGLDNFKVEASDEDLWKLLGRYFVSFCIFFDSPGDFQKSILHISPRGFPISPGPVSHDIPERSCGWRKVVVVVDDDDDADGDDSDDSDGDDDDDDDDNDDVDNDGGDDE